MLTRRALVAGTGAALAAPLITSQGIITPARAATPKGILVMVKQIDDIISFDPAESYEFSNNEMDANCYRRLVQPDPARSGELSGDLAESWDVSPDGLTFTFKLRTDPKFDSGKPVTAEDVVFSLQRVVLLNKTPGFILTQFGFTKDNVADMIRAVDPTTVQIRLTSAWATSFVLYCLSANVGSVVEKAAVMAHATDGDLGNAWLKTNTAGAGPYRLTSWQASDSMIADANPHFGSKVGVRRIVVKHVAEPATQLLMLQKGDADIARDLTADQLRSLMSNKDYGITSAGQATSMYIAMNQADANLARPGVQQAIKWAVDYEAIALEHHARHLERGPVLPAEGLAGGADRSAVPEGRGEGQGIAAAGRAAGRGFPAPWTTSRRRRTRISRRRYRPTWRQSASRSPCCPPNRSRSSPRTRARQHQLAMLVWGSDYFDPNSNAQAFCENPNDGDDSKLKILAWRSHFRNAELTAAAQAAAKELDSQKRIAMYQDMQRKFQDVGAVRHVAAEERNRGVPQGRHRVRRRSAAGLHALRRDHEELRGTTNDHAGPPGISRCLHGWGGLADPPPTRCRRHTEEHDRHGEGDRRHRGRVRPGAVL